MPYKDKTKQAAWSKKNYIEHREEWEARRKRFLARKRHVKGIGWIDRGIYDDQFATQNGLCGICQKQLEYNGANVHFDHDHETGKLRELLCHNCNPGLGQFHESIWKLERAIAYLKKHGKH